ncbi:hypothetical protein [Chlorogloea sp. CCALA 695]|uniref:hypothetical protein n=1 Tax=Chlorogloea sp. CCALA 695 TaxID=2107693 RepID=UPI0018EAFBE1|nr:hypothetical protein [Chlorogloea sp. CCALA 695]
MDSKSNSKKPSRRQVLGGLSVGFVAAQAAPIFAQQSSPPTNKQEIPNQEASRPEIPNQSVKRNSVNQYPSPPFPRQAQEWPGLASKMTLRPDHGGSLQVAFSLILLRFGWGAY